MQEKFRYSDAILHMTQAVLAVSPPRDSCRLGSHVLMESKLRKESSSLEKEFHLDFFGIGGR